MMMLRRASPRSWHFRRRWGFILASELQVPDCVYALGVMRQNVGCVSGRVRFARRSHGRPRTSAK